jgi:hypothetical protein
VLRRWDSLKQRVFQVIGIEKARIPAIRHFPVPLEQRLAILDPAGRECRSRAISTGPPTVISRG